MSSPDRRHRNTIFVEDVEILSIETFADEQFVIRVNAPKCAKTATPGSFIHLRCDDAIPMRRPLSIMRADAREGWIEVLFKIVGAGLHALADRQPGDRLNSLGPIGHGFVATAERRRPLLIGGGVGIPPMVFLAERLREADVDWQPLVLMGSEIPFPFELAESVIETPWLDAGIHQTLALLERWNVPARLASLSDFAGTFRGYVPELADRYLTHLSAEALDETEIFACGPTPMLAAVAALARKHRLPCQVSLEEHMACAVGGCAGCTVRVDTAEGTAMKRVCVDGPVFDAASVFALTDAA